MTKPRIDKCPRCGESPENAIRRGHGQVQCKACGKFYPYDKAHQKASERIVEHGDNREITQIVPSRITSLQQLVSQCEIDIQEWEVERWVCNKWEVGAKDQTGTVKITPLFQVKAWLVRRIEEVKVRGAIEEMLNDARKFSPKYPKIKYPKLDNGLLYEIGFPDLHLGKLAWREESGHDYDIKIAAKLARGAVEELLSYVQNIRVSKILLPIGNDFLNVDNALETTTAGTRQSEDTRWQKTFVFARRLLVELIDTCSLVAPVDVYIIPGNHDKERMFYMGDAMDCWYNNNQNVQINNQAMSRKYYSFGKNLIGFTHGSDEKFSQLPTIMAYEKPELWGRSVNREWHLGHVHHKQDLVHATHEDKGVVIRLLRSLSAYDEWHYRKGFVGARRSAESFLWHPTRGVIAQYTSAGV